MSSVAMQGPPAGLWHRDYPTWPHPHALPWHPCERLQPPVGAYGPLVTPAYVKPHASGCGVIMQAPWAVHPSHCSIRVQLWVIVCQSFRPLHDCLPVPWALPSIWLCFFLRVSLSGPVFTLLSPLRLSVLGLWLRVLCLFLL